MREVFKVAQEVEDLANKLRAKVKKTPIEEQAKIHTLQYCGAMLSITSSTLTALVQHLQPTFDINMVNNILKEWNEEEIVNAE